MDSCRFALPQYCRRAVPSSIPAVTDPSDPASSSIPPIDDWVHLLDGRVAVVTGGAGGIGGAISRLFAAHGALVEIVDLDADRAAAALLDITEAGGSARMHVANVRRSDEVEKVAEDVLRERGRVDVLVNNVGDYRPLVRYERSAPEDWQEMLDVNLGHVLLVTRAFLDAMIEAGSGSIVNIHSVEGMRGYPGDPVYAAAKAGVAQFTRSMAVRFGRKGLRVNGIGPDLTQTEQVSYPDDGDDEARWEAWAPAGRRGSPEDQARVALFLASDLSSFVTGHNIPVDGGTLAGGGWFYSSSARRFVNRPPGL